MSGKKYPQVFAEAAARVPADKAALARAHFDSPDALVIFCGVNVVAVYVPASSYYNRGRQYVGAHVVVRPIHDRLTNPTLWRAFQNTLRDINVAEWESMRHPRSVWQQKKSLEKLAEFDAGLAPAIKAAAAELIDEARSGERRAAERARAYAITKHADRMYDVLRSIVHRGSNVGLEDMARAASVVADIDRDARP